MKKLSYMNKTEVEFIGKVKLVILFSTKEIAHHPDEGGIVRAYIEFDDSIQKIHSNNFDDAKPLRWPVWVGKLSNITQEEIL